MSLWNPVLKTFIHNFSILAIHYGGQCNLGVNYLPMLCRVSASATSEIAFCCENDTALTCLVVKLCFKTFLNSLWPSDAIWRHRS